MFFILSKLLGQLVNPLLLLFVGLLAVLVFYRRRYTRRILALVLLVFYALSAPLIINPLVRWWEGVPPASEALRQHYDVAIVLTSGTRPERLVAGIGLVKRGIADKLLIVGGSGDLFDRHSSEARTLRRLAMAFGLSNEQVLTEEVSRNTYEGALKTTEIIRAGQYRDLLLITTALHMYRAAAAFHKQGLFPDLYPVGFQRRRTSLHPFDFLPSVGTLTTTTNIIHELSGVVLYRLRGYI